MEADYLCNSHTAGYGGIGPSKKHSRAACTRQVVEGKFGEETEPKAGVRRVRQQTARLSTSRHEDKMVGVPWAAIAPDTGRTFFSFQGRVDCALWGGLD